MRKEYPLDMRSGLSPTGGGNALVCPSFVDIRVMTRSAGFLECILLHRPHCGLVERAVRVDSAL